MKKLLAVLLFMPILALAQPDHGIVVHLECSAARTIGKIHAKLTDEEAIVVFDYGQTDKDQFSTFTLPFIFGTTSVWLYAEDNISFILTQTPFRDLYDGNMKFSFVSNPLSCNLLETK